MSWKEDGGECQEEEEENNNIILQVIHIISFRHKIVEDGKKYDLRFQVIMVASMMTVFCALAPCSLIETY